MVVQSGSSPSQDIEMAASVAATSSESVTNASPVVVSLNGTISNNLLNPSSTTTSSTEAMNMSGTTGTTLNPVHSTMPINSLQNPFLPVLPGLSKSLPFNLVPVQTVNGIQFFPVLGPNFGGSPFPLYGDASQPLMSNGTSSALASSMTMPSSLLSASLSASTTQPSFVTPSSVANNTLATPTLAAFPATDSSNKPVSGAARSQSSSTTPKRTSKKSSTSRGNPTRTKVACLPCHNAKTSCDREKKAVRNEKGEMVFFPCSRCVRLRRESECVDRPPRRSTKVSCWPCIRAKRSCDKGRPCRRCIIKGFPKQCWDRTMACPNGQKIDKNDLKKEKSKAATDSASGGAKKRKSSTSTNGTPKRGGKKAVKREVTPTKDDGGLADASSGLSALLGAIEHGV